MFRFAAPRWLCLFRSANGSMLVTVSVRSAGLLLQCGIPFTPTVLIAPYLIVAVGVDDMFVLCGSWSRADPRQGVPRRLAQTLAFSGVPITISRSSSASSFFRSHELTNFALLSSITDALSFALLSSAPIFPSAQNVPCPLFQHNGRAELCDRSDGGDPIPLDLLRLRRGRNDHQLHLSSHIPHRLPRRLG